MDITELKLLETKLARMTYAELTKPMRALSTEDLILLLDSRSVKVGDTAAELVEHRIEPTRFVELIVENTIHTSFGKMRVLFSLNRMGKRFPESIDAHIHLLNDRNYGVLSGALFGIVFMGRRDFLPQIQAYQKLAAKNPKRQALYREAIQALEEENPKLYSPYFKDSLGVWK